MARPLPTSSPSPSGARPLSLRRLPLVLGLVALVAACDDDDFVGPGNGVAAPENLTYQVEPNGLDDLPTGVLLRWDFDPDPDISVWRVYSRPGSTGEFGLRGSTTSNSFHDVGVPHLEYFVTAEAFDGIESAPSNTVAISPGSAPPDIGTLPPPLDATASATMRKGRVRWPWTLPPWRMVPRAR